VSEEQKTGTGGTKRKMAGNYLVCIGVIGFVIALLPFSIGGWNRNGDPDSLGYDLAYVIGSLGIWITFPMIIVGLDCRTTQRKYIVACSCILIGSICALASHYLNIHYMSFLGVALSLLAVLFAAESRSQLKCKSSLVDRAMVVISLILGGAVCVCSFLTTSFGPWS
jgi:hypothetical protein